MRKLTRVEKDRKAVFMYSRCSGCIHARCIYYGDMTDSKEIDAKLWFYCNVDLTDLNKPLRFTVKCPRRYDSNSES